jgi:hypothetical protein
MKTKMKTILSVCMLTVLLYACTKSDTPAPLDCMGIENGIAAEDNCQVCHESYMYQGMGVMVTVATLADTAGLEGTFILAGSPDDIAFNPNWNNCNDCMEIPNGVAAMDTCGTCHQSYIYDFINHVATSIDDTTGLALDLSSQMLILAGSAEDIANNPMWNNCK